MSRSDPYCQFPICALAIPADGPTLGRLTLEYSALRAGLLQTNHWGKTLRDAKNASWQNRVGNDFDPENEFHEALAVYLALCDESLKLSSTTTAVENYLYVDEWHRKFEVRFGREPWVRIRSDIVKDLAAGRFDENEFRVLAAIRMAVGNKSHAVVTRERIRYGASGFRDTSTFERYRKDPLVQDVPRLLSTDQAGRLRRVLAGRAIFQSLLYRRRHWHVSFTCRSTRQLAERICRSKSRRLDRRAQQLRDQHWLHEQLADLKKHKR